MQKQLEGKELIYYNYIVAVGSFPSAGKEYTMGKNLEGKECGKGICQRKDGKYAARYTAKDGSRKEKHFDTLPEACNWLADAQYEVKREHPTDYRNDAYVRCQTYALQDHP